MTGFIKLHRSIFDSPEFKGGEMTDREAFIWMVCQCEWVTNERRSGGVIFTLRRGEFVTTIREMADAFSWSKSRTERWINRLKNRDTIGTETRTANGTKRTVVKVNKYREFQDTEKVDRDRGRDSDFSKPGQHKEKKEELPYSRGGVLPSRDEKQKPTPSVADARAPARVSGGGLSSADLPEEALAALKLIRRNPKQNVSSQCKDKFKAAIQGWRDGVFIVCPDWFDKHHTPAMFGVLADEGVRAEPAGRTPKLKLVKRGA